MKTINTQWVRLGVLLLGMGLHSAYADSCENSNTSIDVSTPTEDFAINDNGTAIHRKTGLMWMRCPLGYELSSEGDVCSLVDDDEFTWQQALQIAETTEYGHYGDWRLPNRNELESIVELSCWEPSINTEVFPGTPDAAFWSSSPLQSDGARAWRVNFINGIVSDDNKSIAYPVRLVRDLN
ncbi:DUF1566 domain-containing protein [Marinimicrobium sp. ABcell2]|uniref:Lcl C-terminal domain-containing protein n=1 Tax=Marinimicrobium sp. ABcell2 TaxID=3069751 RepID=UPI0027B2DC5D|nr:DUF1566 domain-containing protein [Marinimicrobium sp. ABcell2]MDQ2075635.1 DUF1566 domain-containing protein [Marinimicrobium sp. ABcell2]